MSFSTIFFLNITLLENYKKTNTEVDLKTNIIGQFNSLENDIQSLVYVVEKSDHYDDALISKKEEYLKSASEKFNTLLEQSLGKTYFPKLYDFVQKKLEEIKVLDTAHTEILERIGAVDASGTEKDFKTPMNVIEEKIKDDKNTYLQFVILKRSQEKAILKRDESTSEAFDTHYKALLKLIIENKNCTESEIENLKLYRKNFLLHLDTIKEFETVRNKIENAEKEIIALLEKESALFISDTHTENDTLVKKYNSHLFTCGILYAVFLLIVLLVTHFYLRSIFSNIKNMQAAVKKLAEGDSETVIPGYNRNDEIGDIAKSLDSIRLTCRKMYEIQTGVESLHIGIVLTDADHIITFHNSGFLNIIKQCSLCFTSFDTNDMSHIGIDLSSLLEESSFDSDLNRYTINKGVYHIEIYASEIIDSKNKILGYVYNFTNKSGEKHFQKQLENVVTALLSGDLTQKINTSQISDNFKGISKHFNQVLDIFITFIDDISLMFDDVSKGTLTTEISRSYEGNFERIKNNINASIKNLNDIMYKVLLNTKTIHTETKDIILGIDDLSQRTETQASSLQETAAAMVELSSAVQNNTENAINVKGMMEETNKSADNGQNIVKLSIDAMDHIRSSSKEISKIISLIDEIAFQTNLLALNAAVEAARAGDSGKGFAVVAEEVRNLAQRSTEASKQIKKLIDDSTSQVQNGVQLVNQSGENFNTILSSIKQVTVLVNGISTASVEQASTLNQINDAITQMDEITQNNAILVQQNASSMTSLAKYGNNLLALLAQFKIESQKKTEEK